jgi:hypothetical protein
MASEAVRKNKQLIQKRKEVLLAYPFYALKSKQIKAMRRIRDMKKQIKKCSDRMKDTYMKIQLGLLEESEDDNQVSDDARVNKLLHLTDE